MIKNQKLIFVSVPFFVGNDNITRRYQSYKSFKEANITKEYLNGDIALWQLQKDITPNLQTAKDIFEKEHVVKNRILIKKYQNSSIEDECKVSNSYWNSLTKYSANCSFYDIVEEEFAHSTVMLGGTHSSDSDNFEVLDVLNASTQSGIDMHANTLMTLLYLDAPLDRLSVAKSSTLVFVSFFLIYLLVSLTLLYFDRYNSNLEFILVLVLNTLVMLVLSIYLLKTYHLWFNWVIPLVLYEVIDLFNIIKEVPILKKSKFKKRKSR
jgi:CHASE2 domain-containing sensor protein